MHRLYYLADDVETAGRISDALHAEGITDWNFHVVSRDEAGLITHDVHAAKPYQQLDVLHTGSRFALAGGALGLAAALACYLLQPLPWAVNGLTAVLMVLVGAFFGGWQGGMVGLTRESYKLAAFHDDIAQGRYLIMVDVRRKQRSQVRELMNMTFPYVDYAGIGTTFVNPFEVPRRIYHQTTH